MKHDTDEERIDEGNAGENKATTATAGQSETLATATARAEDPPANETKATTDEAGAGAEAVTEEFPAVTGFAPFRFWANRELRKRGTVLISHGGKAREVEELTVDGQ